MTRLYKATLILLLNVMAVATSMGAITIGHTPVTVGCADTFATNKPGTLYQWNFGPNAYPQTFSSAIPGAATAFLTPGSHTVYVTITNGGGTVADSVTFNVAASSDTVSLSANMTVCAHNRQEQPNVITFTASPSGYSEYAFFVDDSLYQFTASNTFATTLNIGDSVRAFGFNGSCFTNASTQYDHTPSPPNLASTLPTGDTICAGTLITFTATPTAPGDSFLFYVGSSLQQGSPANTWNSSTLQDSSEIFVLVFNSYGCVSYFYSNIFWVRVKPTPEMTITASDSAICPGNSVTFTGTALQANANVYSFSINSTVEQTGAGNTYTSSSLVNNDTITVTGTLNGCTGKPSPPVIETVFTGNETLSIASNAPNNAICQGGRVTFSATPNNYHGYQFYDNGVLVQSGTSSTYVSDSISDGDHIYATATQPGCPPPPSDTLVMSVSVLTVSAGSNVSLCLNGPLDTLSVNANPQGGFWTGQQVDSAGIFDPNAACNCALTYTYIDTSNGCSGSAQIIINVPLTSVQVSPVYYICQDSVQINVNGIGVTYSWQPSSGLSCTTCPNPVASPTNTTTYYVTGTSTSTGCSGTDSVLVIVNNLFTSPLFTDTNIASGTPITLAIDTSGTTGQVNYTWVPMDSISNSHIPNPVVSPLVTTVYTLFDTSGGCTDSFSITVNVSTADTFAMPTGFTPNGDGHDDYLLPVFNAKGYGGAVIKTFKIYNRFGQLVYDNSSTLGWDGKFKGVEQPVGTYVYYVAVQLPEQTSEKKMEGSVVLLR